MDLRIGLEAVVGHIAKNNPAEAMVACQQLLAEHPRSEDCYHLMAILHRRAGQADAARQSCRRAIAINPAVAAFLHTLGTIHSDGGDYPSAKRHLSRAIRLNPLQRESLSNLVLIAEAERDIPAVVAYGRRVLAVDPGDAAQWSRLGMHLRDLGEVEAAQAAMDRAQRLSPDAFTILRRRSIMLMETGRFDEAGAVVDRAHAVSASADERTSLLAIERAARDARTATHQHHVGTVVIPAFKAESYVVRALDSVERSAKYYRYRASRPDAVFRVVVVDDNSPDGTGRQVQQWAQGRPQLEVVTVAAHRNRGAGHSRNLGASLAVGPYLWFLDADDLMLPAHLFETKTTLDRRPEWAAVKTGFVLDIEILPDWYDRIVYTCPSNLCVRKCCHELLGGFLEEDCARGLEDGFYMDCLISLFTIGVKRLKTVWHTHQPGNAFDGQIDRFLKTPADDTAPGPASVEGMASALLNTARKYRAHRLRRSSPDWRGPSFRQADQPPAYQVD